MAILAQFESNKLEYQLKQATLRCNYLAVEIKSIKTRVEAIKPSVREDLKIFITGMQLDESMRDSVTSAFNDLATVTYTNLLRTKRLDVAVHRETKSLQNAKADETRAAAVEMEVNLENAEKIGEEVILQAI